MPPFQIQAKLPPDFQKGILFDVNREKYRFGRIVGSLDRPTAINGLMWILMDECIVTGKGTFVWEASVLL